MLWSVCSITMMLMRIMTCHADRSRLEREHRTRSPEAERSAHHSGSIDGPRRSAGRRGRITLGEAATADSQSLAAQGAQPARVGSDPRRYLCAVHAPGPGDALGDRAQTVDDSGLPSDAAPAQVPLALHTEAPSLWTQRSIHSTGRRHRRDQAAQSHVGCPRIAQQIALAFDLDIDKDVVRRVLAAHYRPDPNVSGPSWLTFLGHAKDSLWSVDLFRCESAILRTHWVLVVMDQCTRRIIGSASRPASWTVRPCAACSTTRWAGSRVRGLSVRTMIRCTGSTNGTPTFECCR